MAERGNSTLNDNPDTEAAGEEAMNRLVAEPTAELTETEEQSATDSKKTENEETQRLVTEQEIPASNARHDLTEVVPEVTLHSVPEVVPDGTQEVISEVASESVPNTLDSREISCAPLRYPDEPPPAYPGPPLPGYQAGFIGGTYRPIPGDSHPYPVKGIPPSPGVPSVTYSAPGYSSVNPDSTGPQQGSQTPAVVTVQTPLQPSSRTTESGGDLASEPLTHLWLAMAVCCFCCPLFGCIAILYSVQSHLHHKKGEIGQASLKARMSIRWSMVGAFFLITLFVFGTPIFGTVMYLMNRR